MGVFCFHGLGREYINLLSVLLFDFACGTPGSSVSTPGTTPITPIIQELQENFSKTYSHPETDSWHFKLF